MSTAANAMTDLEALIEQINSTPATEPPKAGPKLKTESEQPAATPEKPKRQRKKKEAAAETPAVVPEKPKAPRKPRKKADPVESQAAAPEEPQKPAEEPVAEPPAAVQETPKPERVFFGVNKMGRLEHTLGGNLGKFLVYDMRQLELEQHELDKVIADNKLTFRKLAQKVQNRITYIIDYVSGRRAELNPVVKLALRLLCRDRVLNTGDQGNLHQRLLKASYTVDTAKSMANSTLGALRALQVIKEGAKAGEWLPNEHSTFLAKLSDRMGLSFIDVEAMIEADDKKYAEELAALKAKANEPTITLGTDNLIGDSAPPAGQEGGQADTPSDDASLGALLNSLLGSAGAGAAAPI